MTAALDALAGQAAGDGNLMPAIIAAVRAEATLGEICSALRDGVRRLPAGLRSPDLSPGERPWAIITPP